ncbi:hypothetical protein SAMD00023353_0202280 [Rosellinia necatrix]|uniref:Uncharacterized protein n=1 Tax=Rosellinia necatrix TaxID=77044 RepID=A0A1S7UK55_ROSNE|nr:hypothetical protein SAMD00023353_0202280 [Rosellinia necatrix]
MSGFPLAPVTDQSRYVSNLLALPTRGSGTAASKTPVLMEGSIKVILKGVMGGAAIATAVFGREYGFHYYLAGGLFIFATIAHVLVSRSIIALPLYTLTAILVIAIVVVSRLQSVFLLNYVPVLVICVLWVLQDYAHPYPSTPYILPWTRKTSAGYCPSTSLPTRTDEAMLSSRDSTASRQRIHDDDDESITSHNPSLILRCIGSFGQSCAPSSRSSDISLPSSMPERPPSSWGTPTLNWFLESSVQERNSSEPNWTKCQKSQTV